MKPTLTAAVLCGLASFAAATGAVAQAPPSSPAPSVSVPSPAQPSPSLPVNPLPPPPPAAPSRPTPSVAGLWEQSDDEGRVGAWFLFTETDGFYEGRLVKMFPKPGEPVFEICAKCTGDQKNARMLGLTVIEGMKRYGFEYKDGSILDPRDGAVYHAQMAMSPDGKTLSVRGYLFMPMLGQTQIWKRLPNDALGAADVPKEILVPPAH